MAEASEYTNEMIKSSARDHVVYNWAKSPWGNWSDEQKKIYNEEFDKYQAKKQQVIKSLDTKL